METAEKIKLVVVDNHTLGFIHPELPNYVQILHASILRGATTTESLLISSGGFKFHNIRLASEQDFDAFRVYFGQFGNKKEYEYQS